MAKKQESNRDVFEVAADDVAGTGPYPHKRKRLPKKQEENLSEALAAFTPIAVGALAGGAAFNRLSKPMLKRLTKDQNKAAWKASRGEIRANTAVGAFGGGVGGALLSDSGKKRRK